MQYYSNITKQLYDTPEECEKAEAKVVKAREDKKLAEQKKSEERKVRAKAIEDAYQEFTDAQKIASEKRKAYQKLLDEFVKDYGSYHATIRSDYTPFEDLFFDFLRTF